MPKTTSSKADHFLIGHRYQLVKKLGEGGMGSVYEAEDKLLNQQVALKRVKNIRMPVSANDTIDLNREVLAREFQVMASLHHPHIIKVLDFGFDGDGRTYYTMKLLDKPQTIIEFAKNASFHDKIILLIQTLQALVYLHRHGILHRDIKPSNILVDERMGLQVVDFGLAIKMEHRQQRSGTLAYMSPEAIRGRRVNIQSDLYSFGVVAYELFAGVHPFISSQTSRLITDILYLAPDAQKLPIPEALKIIILRLLAKAPEDRYTNASMVIQALGDFLPTPIVEDDSLRESVLQSPKFVSREAELITLTKSLQNVLEGIGSAWLIGGESGVGKSRLLEEMRVRALVTGAMVIREQYAQENPRPYQLWQTVIQHLSLFTPLDEPDGLFIKQFLKRTSSKNDSREYLQHLATILIKLFKNQTMPVVLLIDDLQWAQESLHPLKAICKKVSDLPLLVIGTYRNDEDAYFYGKVSEMNLLELRRFSQQAVKELAVSIIGEVGKRQGIAEFLYTHTEGNAFFVIETLRSLAMKAGKLDDIGQITLPPSIFSHGMKDIVQRRLNRLSPQHQSILKHAAIIGKGINFDLLTAILGKFDDNNLLLKCVDADIFRFVEGKWYFSHDKLREGIIKTISQEEYIQLNRQIATAICQKYGDDIEYTLALACHWFEGGEIRKAIEILLNNIPKLFRAGMLLETTPHIEVAITHTSGKSEFAQEQCQLYFYLGKVYEFKGDYQFAHHHYQTSYEQATALKLLEVQVNACIGLARVHRRSGEFEESTRLLQPLLANQSISIQQKINILAELAFNYLELHEFNRAKELYSEALQVSSEINNPLFTANIHTGLADVALFQRQFEDCFHHTDIAHAIFTHLQDEFGLAKCLSIRQLATSFQGKLDESIELAHQLMVIYEHIGDTNRQMTLHGNLAFSLAQKHQYQASRIYFERAIALARDLGALNSLANRLGAYAQVQILLLDWDGARTSLYEWLCVSDYIQNLRGMIHGFYGMADLAIHDCQFVRAGEYIGIIEANATPQNMDIDELTRLNQLIRDNIGTDATQQAIAKGKETLLQDMVNHILAQSETIFGENYPNVIKLNHV